MGPPQRFSRALPYAVAGLPLLLWTQRAWVRPTNFGGFDEWPMLHLPSRFIVDVAYANRPLGLVWLLPAAAWPYTFRAFVGLSFAYLLLAALAVFRIHRRLRPERPLESFLAASLVLVWAPGDLARLSTVESALYAGITFGTMATIAAFVESWFEGRVLTLLLACVLVVAVARSYEGCLALLAAAPVLLLLTQERSRRLMAWCAAWTGAVGVSAAWALAPLLRPAEPAAYQLTVLKPEFDPRVLLGRVGLQYAYHLAPLALSPIAELGHVAVGLAVVVFALLFGFVARGSAELGEPSDLVSQAGWVALGLTFGGLGYCLIVIGSSAPSAFRLEFLSGPGIAVALASTVFLLAGLLPRPARGVVALLLASWVVAVGTGRTVAMQRTWDEGSAYAKQVSMLRGLVGRAPDFRRGTIVLLLDEGGAWRATFGFHHAIQYLYQGDAAGCVWGAWSALYPATLGPEGLHSEPWPVIQRPWRVAPHTYRYDEIVVARFADGVVGILPEWPATLPPLPPGARYDPASRIVASGQSFPERAVLDSP
ncbi:MAG: hypothetical protein ACHQNV_07640 [Vicinamibacteria bacterium]